MKDKSSPHSIDFDQILERNKLEIKSVHPEILQLNLGYLCNQQCAHCHVDASPYRKELMNKEMMIVALQKINELGIKTVDLTGGAPEMNPNFKWLVKKLKDLKIEIIVRSNLTILVEGKFKELPAFLAENQVRIISSLPCYTQENVDKQRGNGVFQKSIKALKKLNELGYGKDANLKLDLVFNPGGPTIAPLQDVLELDYKKQLKADFGIVFSQLFCITNLPIARFKEDLEEQDKLTEYLELLRNNFNPHTINNLMCRNTISVSFDGKIYDCDFNQMLKIESDGITGIENLSKSKLSGRSIKTGMHCLGCTAGSGSSCQGAIA